MQLVALVRPYQEPITLLKKKVPVVIKNWVFEKYPKDEFTHEWYWYWSERKEEKVFGCVIKKHGESHIYSLPQVSESEF